MHRIVILTDLHLRSDYLPGYLDAQVNTLLQLVNKKPPDSVVINGDIFHKRNPKGEELLAFRYLLENLHTKNIFVNRGNHDTISKDGSSDTTLSLFSDLATIIKDYETIRIGGVNFDFIPHYEDEEKIIYYLNKSTNHVFGHFGFDGCVVTKNKCFNSYVKKSLLKKGGRFSFLGHIHKPKVYDGRVYVLGTQYSTTFGEANSQKFIHELIIRDGSFEVVRKPINFGIRHVVAALHEIDEFAKKYDFPSFYTILRVKMDTLDESSENELKKVLLKEHAIKHVEIVFDDILSKHNPSTINESSIFTINDDIIEEYITNSDSVFSTAELKDALKEINEYENQ